MQFEFATANRIIFGQGTLKQVPALAALFGRRVFLVADSEERCEILMNCLKELDLSVVLLVIVKEPDLNDVMLATRKARESACQVVLGFGGGSTLDTGKSIAAMMNNGGDLLDYLEVIGTGRKLELLSLPYIAIPTTAGTGSEVTRNAVINVPERRIKTSLRSPFLLPTIAVIDPELTYSLPPAITASTGMDALTQLIEPFVSNSPTPLTDALCRDGIPRAAESLTAVSLNALDFLTRQEMALASLLGGIALANARLGAVHGMANPIGGMTFAPHGAICARLLPLVMETNLSALRARQPDSPALDRYNEVARLLTGNKNAISDDGVTWTRDLSQALHIRPLREYGMRADDFPSIVEQSQKASSMRGNPIALTDSELIKILESAS